MVNIVRSLLTHWCQKQAARAAARRPAPFRLAVEALEDRRVPAASISGHVYLDATGNGLQPGEAAQRGVTVRLFVDSNHNGVLDSRDHQVGSRETHADGAFSFTGLAANQYFVREAVPSGYVRTGPTTPGYFSVNLATNQAVAGQDFANFHKLHTGVVSHVSYTVTTPGGVSTVVTNLRGHTQQGDTVTVNFTVARGATTTLTLVSYTAPAATYDPNTASQQKLFQMATGTFGAGQHSLTVQLPNDFYQVDFVVGSAITHFGPAGSNIFYSNQCRLLSADNGGSAAAAASLSGTVTDDSIPGPPPAGSVTLTLKGFDSNGTQVSQASTTSDGSGAFSFPGLQPGVTYTLSVTDNTSGLEVFSQAGITVNNGSITGFDVHYNSNSGGGGMS
jgi:hypothetical protein